MGLSTTNADDGPFQLGEIVEGRYRILRLVGAGGIGRVYEAEHDYVGRHVALKALYNKAGDHHERMRLEARALAKIRHPNVVPVMDGGVTQDGVVWFAMPLLEGRTLRRELHGGALGLERALRYGAQIARGMAEAHRTGLVHRDLKPENVFLVSDDDTVRVLDFGTSKFERGALKTTDRYRVIGTHAYMSPERIQAAPVDLRTDIYALGHMLFEMLTGRHALSEGPGPLDLPPIVELGVRQIYAEVPAIEQYAPGTPGYVQAIVYQALAKDPDRRQPSMDVVAEQLDAARTRYFAERGQQPPPAVSSAQPGRASAGPADEPGQKETVRLTPGSGLRAPSGHPARKETVRLFPGQAQPSGLGTGGPDAAPGLVTDRMSSRDLQLLRGEQVDTAPDGPLPMGASSRSSAPNVPVHAASVPEPQRAEAVPGGTPPPSTDGELRIEADLVVGAASFALAPGQAPEALRALLLFVSTIGSDRDRLGLVQSMLVGMVHSPESSRMAVRRDIETWAEADGHGNDLLQQKIESRLLAFAERWHDVDDAEIEIHLARVAHGAALLVEPSLRLDAAETALGVLSVAPPDVRFFAVGVLVGYARAVPAQRAAARGALLAMLLGGPEDSELARETLAALMLDTARRSEARKRRRAERASLAGASRSVPAVDRRETVERPEASSQPERDDPPCLPTVESARAPEAPRFVQTPPTPETRKPTTSQSPPSRRPAFPRRQFWIGMAAATVCATLVVVVAKLMAPAAAPTTPAPSATTASASRSTATQAAALPATPRVTSNSPRPSASALASAGAPPSKPAPSAAPAASTRTRPTRAAAPVARAPVRHPTAHRAPPASPSAPASGPQISSAPLF